MIVEATSQSSLTPLYKVIVDVEGSMIVKVWVFESMTLLASRAKIALVLFKILFPRPQTGRQLCFALVLPPPSASHMRLRDQLAVAFRGISAVALVFTHGSPRLSADNTRSSGSLSRAWRIRRACGEGGIQAERGRLRHLERKQ